MKEVKLHPGMGRAVLGHLRQFSDLPEMKGGPAGEIYIAGQAVASAVSDLFGDGSAVVYNDVDAFIMLPSRDAGLYDASLKERARNVVSRMDHDDLNITVEYGQLNLVTQSIYSMLATRRKGLLNEVICGGGDYWYPAKNAQENDQRSIRFLKTFDFNCVQVGVRLSDQALVWTPAFEQFLRSREMLIETVKTPLHTAIRWFKKRAELDGVFGHDDRAMEFLFNGVASVQLRCERYLEKSVDDLLEGTYSKGKKAERGSVLASWRYFASKMVFGKEYLKRHEKVAESLAPYFEITPIHDAPIPLHTLKSRGQPEINKDVVGRIPEEILPTYVRAKQGFWKKAKADRIVQVIESSVACRHGTDRYRFFAMQKVGTEYFTIPGHQKALEAVIEDMDQHVGIARMAEIGVPHPVIVELVKTLRQLSKEGKGYAYGFVDAAFHDLAAVIKDLPVEQVSEAVLRFVKNEYDDAVEQKKEAKFLLGRDWKPFVFRGFSVSEIRDVPVLFSEGDAMHHCVGGYIGQVYSGRSAILSMHKHRVQDRLTLEIGRSFFKPKSPSDEGPLCIAQLAGLCNRSATEEEKAVAQAILMGLNLRQICRGFLPAGLACTIAGLAPVKTIMRLKSLMRVLASNARQRKQSKASKPFDWDEIPF